MGCSQGGSILGAKGQVTVALGLSLFSIDLFLQKLQATHVSLSFPCWSSAAHPGITSYANSLLVGTLWLEV